MEEEREMDLDTMMNEGMRSFEEDDPITPNEDAPEKPDLEVEPEIPEVAQEEEAAPEKPVEAEPETEKEKNLRFKSHEEAEKGYRHLQSEKTRVEQRYRDMERRVREMEELSKKAEAETEFDSKYAEYSAERHKKALADIDTLDPDDEQYQEKVSRIWAEKDLDIRRFDRENTYTPEQPQVEPAEQQHQALDFVKAKAVEANLDPEDRFFKQICREAPAVDDAGQQIPFESQVQWAIEQTTNYHAEMNRRFKDQQQAEAEAKNKATVARTQPMGRSGTPKPKANQPVIVTLEDALNSAMDARRL